MMQDACIVLSGGAGKLSISDKNFVGVLLEVFSEVCSSNPSYGPDFVLLFVFQFFCPFSFLVARSLVSKPCELKLNANREMHLICAINLIPQKEHSRAQQLGTTAFPFE